jgi:hypothetical protein
MKAASEFLQGQAFHLCHSANFVFDIVLLVDFLQCTYHTRLSEQFSGSQALSVCILVIKIADVVSLKRVPELIFRISG